jgi:hypothetical protein
VKHYASVQFWELYEKLPEPVRRVADKSCALLKTDPHHPSLHFKKVGPYYSVRVGRSCRALAAETHDGLLWFWIGSHSDYERITD